MSKEKFNMFFCVENEDGELEVEFLAWRGTEKQAKKVFRTECAKAQKLVWARLHNVSRHNVTIDKIEPKE